MFPIPRDSLLVGGSRKGRRYELIDKDDQRDISLHHLIRKESNKFSKKIREFDRLFEANQYTPENVTDKKVCFYLYLLTVFWLISICITSSLESTSIFFPSASPVLSQFTSSSTCQPTSLIIPTLIIHHSFTLGSKPTFLTNPSHLKLLLTYWTAFTIMGLDRTYHVHYFIFSFTFYSVW